MIELVVEIVVVAVVCCVLTFYYSEPRLPTYLATVVAASWFFSFSTVAFASVDLQGVIDGRAVPQVTPDELANSTILTTLWLIVYWTVIVLQLGIISFMTDYIQAGEFNWRGRCMYALKQNVIWLIGGIVVLAPFFLWILFTGRMSLDRFMGLIYALSYLFNLLLVVVLFGHGLVDFPKSLWYNGSLSTRLKRIEYKVMLTSMNLNKADSDLEELVAELSAYIQLLEARDQNLQVFVNKIVARLPEQYRPRAGARDDRFKEIVGASESKLADLHRRVKSAAVLWYKLDRQYRNLIDKAISIEDVLDNKRRGPGPFKALQRPEREGDFGLFLDKMEWWWRCWIKPVGSRILSVFFMGLSLLMLASEASTPFAGISVFSMIISKPLPSYALQLLAIFIMSYMCLCIHAGLFKMKFFNTYDLLPGNSDGWSLLMNAYLSLKVIAASTFHFYTLFNITRETAAYQAILRPMDEAIAAFNSWLPYLVCTIVLISALLTFLGAFGKLSEYLRLKFLQVDEEYSAQLMSRGRDIVRSARQRREARAAQEKLYVKRPSDQVGAAGIGLASPTGGAGIPAPAPPSDTEAVSMVSAPPYSPVHNSFNPGTSSGLRPPGPPSVESSVASTDGHLAAAPFVIARRASSDALDVEATGASPVLKERPLAGNSRFSWAVRPRASEATVKLVENMRRSDLGDPDASNPRASVPMPVAPEDPDDNVMESARHIARSVSNKLLQVVGMRGTDPASTMLPRP